MGKTATVKENYRTNYNIMGKHHIKEKPMFIDMKNQNH